VSFHNPESSFIEAVFSRGDRRLSEVLLTAWRNGARFDSWSEEFRFAVWADAFRAHAIDPSAYACRSFPVSGVLAWDHIALGPGKPYLLSEYSNTFLTNLQ
jgi:hypothetical protein